MEDLFENMSLRVEAEDEEADLGNDGAQSTCSSTDCSIIRFIRELGADDDADSLCILISQHFKNLLNAAIQCGRPKILEYIIDIVKQCNLDVKFTPCTDSDDYYQWKWILDNCAAGQVDRIVGLSLYEQRSHHVYTSDDPMDYYLVRDILIREFKCIDN